MCPGAAFLEVEMLVHSWADLTAVLSLGGLLILTGGLLLGAFGTRPIHRMTVTEVAAAVVLGHGTAMVMLSTGTSLASKTVLVALAAAAFAAGRWWSAWMVSRTITEPTLIFHRGQFIQTGLRRSRLGEADVLASLRAQGIVGLQATDTVVACPDGSVSLVRTEAGARPTLHLVSSRDGAGKAVLPK
jgi:uncharacterized membrane protein YcaP (DUF421 family)